LLRIEKIISIEEELILTQNQMSYNGIYTVELDNYKELRGELDFADYYEQAMLSREIIYFIHFSNLVMDAFLHSNETIEIVLGKMKMVSLDDYMDGADLI